jgi:hypothetical protein
MPSGDFTKCCGSKILMTINDGPRRGTDIYDGDVKASPLTFPPGSILVCSEDGQKLVFIDYEAGLVSDVDIAAGIVTRTLAKFDAQNSPGIFVHPI